MARTLQRAVLPQEGFTKLMEVQDDETKDLFAAINNSLYRDIFM